MTDPDLGLKPLLAKLREQQPDVGTRVRERESARVSFVRFSPLIARGAPRSGVACHGATALATDGVDVATVAPRSRNAGDA